MDFLSTTGQVTSQDVVEILKIAKRTAQLKLKNLVEKKLIKMEGKGPASYYILS
jgi:predicted HTH transcriptional regulator